MANMPNLDAAIAAATDANHGALIEQDLTNPALSLAGCFHALRDYAKANAQKGEWACGVLAITPDNPVVELQAQPVGVAASVVVDEEMLAQERERVRTEMQAALEQAEARAEQAAAKLEKAKSPAIAKANFLFGELQNVLARLTDALTALASEQPETADRLRQALREKVPEMCRGL